MRSFSSGILKFIAITLTFLLGFITCLGALAGGLYIAASKVSLDTFKVDTSPVIDRDAAKVDVPSMTVLGAIEEFKNLRELGDGVTINALVARYGLILPDAVDPFLPGRIKEMPITKVFSKEGVDELLNNVYFGQIFRYDSIENPDKTDEKHKYLWYDHESGKQIVGINHEISNYTLAQFVSDGIDIDALVETITIGEVMDMTSRSDFPIYLGYGSDKSPVTLDNPIVVWYDRGGERSEPIISALAPYSVNDVEPALHSMTIGEIMGYVIYEDEYYSWDIKNDGEGEYISLASVDGIASELSDMSLDGISAGNLDTKVKGMQVSDVMGYKFNETTGKWEDENGELSGVMASVAGYKIGELNERIPEITVGDLSDFTLVDGVWYSHYDAEVPENCVVANGVVSIIADLTINELSHEETVAAKVEKVTLADALGYTYDEDEGAWVDKNGTEISGVMSVLADTPIKSIQSKIDNSDMGELMGFTLGKKTVVEDGVEKEIDWWYSEDEDGNIVATHPLMNKVASTTFDKVDSLADDLVLSDIIPEEDRKTGFVSLADPNTSLTKISEEMERVFDETTFDEYLDCGAVEIENPESEAKFRAVFGNQTLSELLDWVIDNM